MKDDDGRWSKAEEVMLLFLADLERLPKQMRNTVSLRQSEGNAHTSLSGNYLRQGRDDEAVKEGQTAIAINKQLANEFPSVPHYRRDLAWMHVNLGNKYYMLRRWKEAEQEHRLALELLERLAADFPEVANYVNDVGWRQIELGRDDCLAQGCSAQALDWLELAEKNFRRAHSLMPDERIQAWIEEIRCARARALAQLKRYEDAVAEAQGCGAKPRDLFNVACAYSLLSAAALQNDKLAAPDRARISEAHASRAVELLAGIDWKNNWNLEPLKTDKDLDPLRARKDFIDLVKRAEKASAKQAGK